jgi:hypothetical protein
MGGEYGYDSSTDKSSSSFSGKLTVYGGEDGTTLVYSKTVNDSASYQQVAGYFGIDYYYYYNY